MNAANICAHYYVRSLGVWFPWKSDLEGLSRGQKGGWGYVIGWVAPTLPPGPSEPSPSSAELALSRSLEREGRCLRPLASSWARALCKLLSSLTVSGTAKSKSANQVEGAETRHMRTASPEGRLRRPPALTPQTFNKCFPVPGTGNTDEVENRVSRSPGEPDTRACKYSSVMEALPGTHSRTWVWMGLKRKYQRWVLGLGGKLGTCNDGKYGSWWGRGAPLGQLKTRFVEGRAGA